MSDDVTLEDVLSRTNVTDADCWEWAGAKNNHGYGQIRRRLHLFYVHRLSYELHIGPVPAGLHVLHKCDNPPCVNPAHLFVGTHAENMIDRTDKGRTNSRLSRAEVRDIRTRFASGETKTALAAAFGVTITNVTYIVTRRHWKQVP